MRFGLRLGTADDRDENGLLALCPKCTYSLVGLPVEHHCPECGFELDRRWEVFGGPLARRRWKTMYRALLGFVVFDLLITVGLLIYLVGKMSPLFLALVLLTGVIPLGVIFLIGRVPRFVVVGADDVGVFDGRSLERIALSNVNKMEFHPFRKMLQLTTSNGVRQLSVNRYFVANQMEAAACAKAVDQAKREHQARNTAGVHSVAAGK